MMMNENLLSAERHNLNFNGNKIRWLTDSQITPTDKFVIGSGERSNKVSLWQTDNTAENFAPTLLFESDLLDGDVTEIKAKNKEEFFVSTANGSVFYFRHVVNDKLELVRKWSDLNLIEETEVRQENESIINNFDFDSGCDELCCVGDDGSINFISLHQSGNTNTVSSFDCKETCGLNSVLYLKQYEIAVADSLGRIKLWDTRNKDRNRSSMTLIVDGECSPILTLANHPNQQHLIASGNLNGLIFVYDVRSQKKPLIMCHNHSQPILEIGFNPFSCDNLFSTSMDGALWFWNVQSKGEFASYDEKNIDTRNYLPNNHYALNSFDINNEHIIAVNNNYGLFKLKNINFM